MSDYYTQPLDLHQLSNMLNFISADTDREEWVKVLMSIKSEFGEDGKGVAIDWSATASNYDVKAFNATWKSIKSDGGVSIGSLVKMAIDNGFKFSSMSKDDKKRLHTEHLARKKQRTIKAEQDRLKRVEGYKTAKIRANDILSRSVRASHLHPYFFKKGISEDVRRTIPIYLNGTALIVPVMQFIDQDSLMELKKRTEIFERVDRVKSWGLVAETKMFEVSSLQFIEQDGSKLFLKGGMLKGGFYPICFNGYVNEIVICEGYATGITLAVHYAPLSEVICAFNANNLIHVAKSFKRMYPTANIIIASDNDKATENKTGVNVGIKKATIACKAVDGKLWIPYFEEGEVGTDWNDRYLLDTLDKSRIKSNQAGGAV